MTTPQKFKTCLWFENNAEEATRHYLSVFKRSRIIEELRAGDGARAPRARSCSPRSRSTASGSSP